MWMQTDHVHDGSVFRLRDTAERPWSNAGTDGLRCVIGFSPRYLGARIVEEPPGVLRAEAPVLGSDLC